MLVIHGLLVQEEGRRLLADGALRLAGSRIVELGSSAELCARHPEEETLDAAGMLVMPGLIAAHTHCYALLARGFVFRGPEPKNLGEILRRTRWKLDEALGYDEIRYSTLLSCAEAIRSGTTTLLDQHASSAAVAFALDASAEAVSQAGLRACLSYQVSDRGGTVQARRAAQENARFARRVHDNELLIASMGLDASRPLSDDTLSAAVGAAALSDIGFHVNLAEDIADDRESARRYGERVIEHLRRYGVLGPRTLVAHGVHLTDDDAALLRRAGSWVVENPRSNAQYGLGQAPIGTLKAHGLNVCLGTDGFSQSLFSEIQAAYLLHRRGVGEPGSLSAQEVMRMALGHNAALASRLFRDRLGVLSVGALADLILVAYDSPTPLTEANLAHHLLLGHDALRVDTTIVGGQVLMRHGRLLTLDEQAIARRTRELVARLWSHLTS